MLINLRNALMAGSSKPAYWGLTFEAEEPNVVINMMNAGTGGDFHNITLETSLNGVNWATFDTAYYTTPITLANVGDKVYFRSGSGGNTKISTDEESYRSFTITGGRCSASGNLMSLLDGEDNTLLAIPANNCFLGLFKNCSLLTTPPALPATTLRTDCYASMFRGCSALTVAPELPATTLRNYCYEYMFQDCTSLTTSPTLPASTPASDSYYRMFYRCSSLTEVTTMLESWGDCTTGWMSGVAATGTFKCPAALGTNETITRGTAKCPKGWTVVNV